MVAVHYTMCTSGRLSTISSGRSVFTSVLRACCHPTDERCFQVSQWYTLVIFTASMQEYADPVIDWLDAGRGILGRRLFREVSSSEFPTG